MKTGIDPQLFPDPAGSQIRVVPNPSGEGYLCPAFDPQTFHCRIYLHRPLDCQIYPFSLMWNADQSAVVLGWDRKCPFMIEHTTKQGNAERLLPEIQEYANQVLRLLDGDQMVTVVVKNPHLITRFQEDVVVIGTLPILTKRMTNS